MSPHASGGLWEVERGEGEGEGEDEGEAEGERGDGRADVFEGWAVVVGVEVVAPTGGIPYLSSVLEHLAP